MWRQGDVLIKQISEIPENAIQLKRTILSAGDTSGHSHKVDGFRKAKLYASTWQGSQLLFLHVLEDKTDIVHPEHGTITLDKGCFRIWKQREFSDAGDRLVLD